MPLIVTVSGVDRTEYLGNTDQNRHHWTMVAQQIIVFYDN